MPPKNHLSGVHPKSLSWRNRCRYVKKCMNCVVRLELQLRFNEGDLKGSRIQNDRVKQICKEFHM
jgi:hypothetical protein